MTRRGMSYPIGSAAGPSGLALATNTVPESSRPTTSNPAVRRPRLGVSRCIIASILLDLWWHVSNVPKIRHVGNVQHNRHVGNVPPQDQFLDRPRRFPSRNPNRD